MIKITLTLLLLLTLLTGCGTPATPTTGPAQTSAPSAAASEPAEPSTATPGAAAPAAQISAVYPAQDARLVEQARELAGTAGWDLQPLASLADLAADTLVLIAAPAAADDMAALSELAAANPDLRLILVGGSLEPGERLSVVAAGAPQAAFLAGYAAALVTPEWRIGVLNLASETQERDAALNGARYLCGICTPKYPPYNYYPLAADLSGPEAAQAEQALTVLAAEGVTTLVLTPQMDRPEIHVAAEAAGMLWLNVGGQPSEDQRAKWVASLSADAASGLAQAWADALAGQPGRLYPAPAGLSAANLDFLGEARQRLLLETAAELESGAIFPGSVAPVE